MRDYTLKPLTDEEIQEMIDRSDMALPIPSPETTSALANAFKEASENLQPVKDATCRNTCVMFGRCTCGAGYHLAQVARRKELARLLNIFMATRNVPDVLLHSVDIPVDITDESFHYILSTVADPISGTPSHCVTINFLASDIKLNILYKLATYSWRMFSPETYTWSDWSTCKYESDKE